MHVIEMIYFFARTVPDRRAIVQGNTVTTYRGLAEIIELIGERVDHLILNKHEPVGVCLANPLFTLATVFALLRNGYSAAPVNKPLLPHLAGAGIRSLIFDTEDQTISGGTNIWFDMSWLPGPRQAKMMRPYRKRAVENVGLHFFTSGTTGLPTKVVVPAAAVDQQCRYPLTFLAEAHQKVLVMAPVMGGFGFNWTCELLNIGKTAYLGSDPGVVLSLINQYGVEVLIASPLQALMLVQLKNKNPLYRTNSLEAIFISGGKIEADGIARVRSTLCRNIVRVYGITGLGRVAAMPVGPSDRAGMVPLPWVELEIVDGVGQRQPAGVEGRIRIRAQRLSENLKAVGPNEISGLRDGWVYPGDVGLLDDDGIIYLVGRTSDVINRGGKKVSGARIEEIVKELPEIRDAAACGVAGPSGLEEIWIAVVAGSGVDIDGVKQHLRRHKDVGIAPDQVFTVDHIPRGDLGKVQQHRLKEQLLALKKGA